MKILALMLMWVSPFVMANSGGGHGDGGGGGAADIVIMDPLIVNLSNDHVISFSPALKLKDPKDQERVKSFMPIIRFKMILSIFGQDAAQVQTAPFVSSFAESAVELINKILGGDYIKDVFFENWITQ